MLLNEKALKQYRIWKPPQDDITMHQVLLTIKIGLVHFLNEHTKMSQIPNSKEWVSYKGFNIEITFFSMF